MEYTLYPSKYTEGEQPGEDQFAGWCFENGLEIQEWIMRVIDDAIAKTDMYSAKTREQFEEAAQELWDNHI